MTLVKIVDLGRAYPMPFTACRYLASFSRSQGGAESAPPPRQFLVPAEPARNRVKPRFELLQIMMRPQTKYSSVSRTAADLLDKISNIDLLDGNKMLGM